MERATDGQEAGGVGHPPSWRTAVLALGYVVAWTGLWLVSNGLNPAASHGLWHLTPGLTFAILLECGARALPLPVAASLIAWLTVWSWETWPYALLAGLAPALGYLAAARALRNHAGDLGVDRWRFNDPQRVAAFLGIGAVGALWAALSGVAILNVAGILPPTRSWLEIALDRWVGDFVGLITVAPLVLVFLAPLAWRFSQGKRLRQSRSRPLPDLPSIRLTVLQGVFSIILLVMLFWIPQYVGRDQPQPFITLLLLPVLAWIVATRGMRGTVLAVFLYELAIAIMVALFGEDGQGLQYQIVMATMAAAGLLTGAVSHARLADIARFRDLAEVSNDLLWEFDQADHLCDLRGSLARASEPYGVQLGRSWRDFVIPQEQNTDFAELKAAIRQWQPFQQLVLRMRFPGQERSVWTRNSGLPVFGEDGEFLGYRGTTTDITDRKQVEALRIRAEAMMRDYDRTLEARVEARVEERTRKLTEASLRNWRLANFDNLTGLPNRNLLFEHLSKNLQQARRQWRLLAVLMVDLDGFKEVNDTLGHDVGDDLLRQVASRLQQCVRATDTAARLGGDEFVIVLTDLDHSESASLVAQKIIASLNEPVPLGSASPVVTASIGIALYRPELPANLDQVMTLLRQADTAMYAAKHAGKNAWRFADDLGVEDGMAPA